MGQYGFLIDWSAEKFQERREATNCTEPISEVVLCGNFDCSSVDVLNSVIDVISCNLEIEGLKKLDIEQFSDKNTLEEWPLSQLLCKASKCEFIRISNLTHTIDQNRSCLLNFVAEVCTMSENLETLILAFTGSTIEHGQTFLQVLADADSSSLRSLEIIGESNWFEGEEGKECINALIVFL